uniref:Uncharacterized protein n=1 Tax=Acrobeloides nanus TaxID=290746 RepID=A0A914DC44_9BILA
MDAFFAKVFDNRCRVMGTRLVNMLIDCLIRGCDERLTQATRPHGNPDEDIHFVEKVDNPANLPEARPVEDFWAALKGMVYAKGWHAENVQQLVNRIKYA